MRPAAVPGAPAFDRGTPRGAALPRRHVLVAGLGALAAGGCASRSASSDGALLDRLRPARYVLLGEVHDNVEHHRLHALLLEGLLADGRTTCVVFEQMDRGHDEAIASAPRDAEAVATAGALDRRGWAWPMHRPVIAAAIAGGATIRGGNLSRDDARAVVRGGATAVPPESSALMSRSGWRPADQAAVEHDIDAGHCGALPENIWPGMALAERARDATLAGAMLRAAGNHARVVLIAGNGHVRRDLAVPRYLLGAGVPAAQIVAVGFLESTEADGAPYDLVRVTAGVDRPDPCEAFRTS